MDSKSDNVEHLDLRLAVGDLCPLHDLGEDFRLHVFHGAQNEVLFICQLFRVFLPREDCPVLLAKGLVTLIRLVVQINAFVAGDGVLVQGSHVVNTVADLWFKGNRVDFVLVDTWHDFERLVLSSVLLKNSPFLADFHLAKSGLVFLRQTPKAEHFAVRLAPAKLNLAAPVPVKQLVAFATL